MIAGAVARLPAMAVKLNGATARKEVNRGSYKDRSRILIFFLIILFEFEYVLNFCSFMPRLLLYMYYTQNSFIFEGRLCVYCPNCFHICFYLTLFNFV